jgi:hypothetical protein
MADPAGVAWVFDAAARAQRFSRSSRGALISLVVGNLVPLVGVLVFGWQVAAVVAVYWLENGVVGVINVRKMAVAEGDGPAGRALKLTQIPFFILHYGMFWFVHGIFVGVIATMTLGPGAAGGLIGSGLDPWLAVVAVVGLAISHWISYRENYIGRGEYLTATVRQQAQAPYGRLVALHLAIIGGAFVIAMLGSPEGPVLVLVAVKIVLDLATHLGERTRAAERGSTAATAAPG